MQSPLHVTGPAAHVLEPVAIHWLAGIKAGAIVADGQVKFVSLLSHLNLNARRAGMFHNVVQGLLEKGKNVARYVPREQIPSIRQAIAGYEQFQNLSEQYAQLIIQKTRAELAAGAKKKTLRQNSSWPKTRKSTS